MLTDTRFPRRFRHPVLIAAVYAIWIAFLCWTGVNSSGGVIRILGNRPVELGILLPLLINLGRRRDLAITEVFKDLEDFAPSRKLAAAAALVEIHGLHELDLVRRVVALARRRIDLPATLDFAAVAFSPLDAGESGRHRRPAAFRGVAAIRAATFDDEFTVGGSVLGHHAFTLWGFGDVCCSRRFDRSAGRRRIASTASERWGVGV